MNKNKLAMTFVVFAVSIIFFTIIFAQFKSVEETDLKGIRTAREEELQRRHWKFLPLLPIV